MAALSFYTVDPTKVNRWPTEWPPNLDRVEEKRLKLNQFLGREILSVVELMLIDSRKHHQSVLCALGSLAGFTSQMTLRATGGQLVRTQTVDGDILWMGDDLHYLVAKARYSIWSLASARAQSIKPGATADIDEISLHTVATIGTSSFGVPRVPDNHRPHLRPVDYINRLWILTMEHLKKNHAPAVDWPIAFSYAVQEAISRSANVVPADVALGIVMESAIPASKFHPSMEIRAWMDMLLNPRLSEEWLSLLVSLEERRENDPSVSMRHAGADLKKAVSETIKDEQSLLGALGALGGFTCQMAARAADGALVREGRFEKKYVFGDAMKVPFETAEFSLWNIVAGCTYHDLGCRNLPSVQEIIQHAVDTAGTAEHGIARVPEARRPADTPENYINTLWRSMTPILNSYDLQVTDWPSAYAFAIRDTMMSTRGAFPGEIALRIAMEYAAAGSHVDPHAMNIKTSS